MFADELNPPEPEPIDFRSVTMKDFNKPEFISKKQVPTKVNKTASLLPINILTELLFAMFYMNKHWLNKIIEKLENMYH